MQDVIAASFSNISQCSFEDFQDLIKHLPQEGFLMSLVW